MTRASPIWSKRSASARSKSISVRGGSAKRDIYVREGSIYTTLVNADRSEVEVIPLNEISARNAQRRKHHGRARRDRLRDGLGREPFRRSGKR